MSERRVVDADELAAMIGSGDVDTVVVAFPDMQGRLVGKRTDAGSRVFLHLLALLSPRK